MKHLLLMAVAAISITSYSQKISNKLTFPKGQKLEMVTDVKSVMTQEMMGQSMEFNINATVTRMFDVEDVTPAGAVIEHKVKRMQFNFDGMGQSQSFDSEKESDMKGDMGKTFEKSIKNKYTMTVDNSGKITAVKSDDDNPNKPATKEEEKDMMGNMMSQFAAGMEMPKTGDVTDLSILPNREIAKGESWTDSLTKDKDEKGKITYTLTDITDNEILLNFTEEKTSERKQEAQGMEITMTSKDKTTGKVTLDKKTGLLKQSTATTDSQGTVEVMGQSMPMSNKMTKTVMVKGF
ncbi:MAG: DUF6263 family protein [Chitinophagaceae bacterium]